MDSSDIYKIFSNQGFTVGSNSLGNFISMNAEDAFIFSSIVGAKYLFYRNGITAKGRYEVFIHRSVFSDSHLIYSPGLFSRDSKGMLTEGNSAEVLAKKYPGFFNGNKKIIIKDILPNQSSNIESAIYDEIIKHDESPNDYVLYKNFLSNNIGESLLEYLSCLFFIKKGYLVENQAPWFQQNYKYGGKTYQGGIPDFSAFHSNISSLLAKSNIISQNKGLFIGILPVIGLFRENLFDENDHISSPSYKNELLIGEAKTSKSSLPQAIKQLEKYDAVHIADELFTIIPDSSSNPDYGSFYIDSNLNTSFNPKHRVQSFDSRKEEDAKWIDTYIKMLLLGNLKFNKIITFISEFRTRNRLPYVDSYESIHLLDAVQNTNNEEFMDFIKENYGIHE